MNDAMVPSGLSASDTNSEPPAEGSDTNLPTTEVQPNEGALDANQESEVATQVDMNSFAPEDQPYDNYAVNVNSGKSAANITDPEGTDYVGEPQVVDKDFTYPTHTDPQRYTGPPNYGTYLDDEMRTAAEITRAKIEGREPDLDSPPAVQGTPLVPTGEVRKNLPGDYVVEPDKQLPVVVGVDESNLTGYGDATHARNIEKANSENTPEEETE